MLNLKDIIKNPTLYKEKLASRGMDVSFLDDLVLKAEKKYENMASLQENKAKMNAKSKEIGKVKAQGGDISEILKSVDLLKEQIQQGQADLDVLDNAIDAIILSLPNIPSDNTPIGKDESENVVIEEHIIGRGKVPVLVSHHEIGVKLDIVDFERAVKIAGARFWAYKGLGAKLVRALENFMLDRHIERGYTELRPPVLANGKALQNTGQLPKFGDDLFKVADRDLYLIPTAEVPLTNFYSNEIVDLTNPIALTAFTPCFRAEAGSGGKDMRGLIRAHQFNKVELVKLVTKEQLDIEFKKTLEDAKNILNLLELPYRELQLCTGDVGFSSEETVDLEVWIPSENTYREISSVSSFSNFQGRRSMIRYKDDEGKNQYAYTINGSGLAIDRTVAAILENYQNNDGSITVPKVLVKYMGIEVIE